MKLLACSLGVFVAVLLTYLPSVRYEFVSYDDHDYVYQNGRVLTGLSVSNAVWAVKSCGHAFNWHPMTWISLQADASFLKEKPTPLRQGQPDDSMRRISSVMHAHNILLHAANATLLFLLIVLMMRRLAPEEFVAFPIAALFALLWAIHPLRTEVVCWVSERKELLSVFFMLLSMIAYIGGRGQRSRSTMELPTSSVNLNLQPQPLLYLLSLIFFALALAAKPVAVTLPVVLFAWDWVMLDRRFGKPLVKIVPFLVMSAGASVLTLMSQGEPLKTAEQFSFLEKLVMSVSAPVIYLRQTLWPAGLSAYYPSNPPVPWIELILGVALVAGSVTVCVAWLRRRQTSILSFLAFAVAWCYVSLVPMLGIVKVGDQPHSDRYTYWVGCGLVAIAAQAVCRYMKGKELDLMKGMSALVVALAVATLLRMPVWKDTFSLCADAVPKSWADQPVCTLAGILRQRGIEGEGHAAAMLREALMHSHSLDIGAELAHLLASRTEKSPLCIGEVDHAFDEARYEAGSVLAADPTHPLANEALAIVEMKEEHWDKAERYLERARPRSQDVNRIDRYLDICRGQGTAGN